MCAHINVCAHFFSHTQHISGSFLCILPLNKLIAVCTVAPLISWMRSHGGRWSRRRDFVAWFSNYYLFSLFLWLSFFNDLLMLEQIKLRLRIHYVQFHEHHHCRTPLMQYLSWFNILYFHIFARTIIIIFHSFIHSMQEFSKDGAVMHSGRYSFSLLPANSDGE